MFAIYGLAEFENYLTHERFHRNITVIQNHHTFQPDYTHYFSNPDHLHWLHAMRDFHIHTMGWDDIAQNLTTFPDGKIALCRPIDTMPAGIYGANKGAICIEHLGNFDEGKDVMTAAHKHTVIQVNALLCRKFSLRPVYEQVVYHHWFDKQGNRFPPAHLHGEVLQKTCPGTGFFGGNTVEDAEKNFYPLIEQAMSTR